MYVSALCFPAVPMIAACSGTHSGDCVCLCDFIDLLLENKEPLVFVGGGNCSCQGQVGQSEADLAVKAACDYNTA